jgi:TolB-like protein/DNA-binding SARP family transcriptional activator/Flp pilus assembly protein TadD
MRVELHLMGRFAASIGGAAPAVLAIASPRLRAILAYLAMQPAYTETRERLAALLWGDSSDKQARQSLRQCLVALRRELGAHESALVVERETVGLDASKIAVDARELLTLAERPDEARARRALALHRGEFLDGLELDLEPFGDWLRAERLRIAAAAARLFEMGAQAADAAGRGADAIALAERLAALDPTDENALRLVLRLTARHRGREAALTRAEAMLVLLRQEVDALPERETAELIASIRAMPAGAPAAMTPRPAERAPEPAPLAHIEPLAPAAPIGAPIVAERRRRRWPIFRLAAAAMLVGGVAVAAIAYDRAGAPSSRDRAKAHDPAWQSPLVPGVGPDRRALAAQGAFAVVVLPFDGEGDAAAERIGDRASGDLINSLTRVPGMRVISRATSRLFRNKPVDVAAIGSELGVRYIVEGSVRSQGDTLRIDVVLTDAKSRLQVWSQRFERPKAESFAVQDDIARGIARHLHIEILGDADRRAGPETKSGEIDALLARGWGAMLQIAASGTSSGADRYFEEVLKRDPENVSALIGLGGYHVTVVAMFLVADPEPHLARAAPLITKAIEKAPRSSMAHYFQGVLHKTKGRPNAALESFARTIELNPSFSLAHAQIGHVLSRTGRLPEALEHIRYAIRLSPKDPNLGLWSLFGGQIELERGNDAAALDWLRRALAVDPRNPFIPATLAAVLALTGDKAGAAKYAAKTRALAPWLTHEKMVERLVGLSSENGKPKRLLEGLRKAFGDPA